MQLHNLHCHTVYGFSDETMIHSGRPCTFHSERHDIVLQVNGKKDQLELTRTPYVRKRCRLSSSMKF